MTDGESDLEEARGTARSPGQVEFTSTENQSWADVDRSLPAWIRAYGTDAEQRRANDLEVSDLNVSTRGRIAARTLLGNGRATTLDDLVAVPVVNPNTNDLNRGALEAARAAAEGARGADLPDADGVFNAAGTLLERHFDFEAEESVQGEAVSDEQAIHESFAQGVALSEARVNRQGNMIQNVALLGRESLNGRVYTDSAMEEAADLYDGAPFYLDHPKKSDLKERRGTRSVLDLAGRIRNPRKVGGQVRGDVEILDREPSKSLVFAIAEQMPQQAGMSHRASGKVRVDDSGTQIVESVTKVKGVELVTEPATVGGLMESIESSSEQEDAGMEYGDLSLTELKEKRPDLIREATEQVERGQRLEELEEQVEELQPKAERAEELEEQVADLEEENEELEEENKELKAKERKREREDMVREALDEADLDEDQVPQYLTRQLLNAEDESAIQEAIAEHVEYLENIGAFDDDGDSEERPGIGAKSSERDPSEDLDEGRYEEFDESEVGEVHDRLFT